MRLAPVLFVAAALAACSRPAPPPEANAPQAPEAPQCNELTPDFAHLVALQDEAAVTMLSAAELRGGPITPGTYDLVSAVRIGGATGWSGQRAVALGVSEGDDGVVLNWAGAADAAGARDTWTATLGEAPSAHITYTCGRMGIVDAAFLAQPTALELRVTDGASGALAMTFQKRP